MHPAGALPGTVYRGLIGRAKYVPTGSQLGVADVAVCDDVGRNPIGPYFPPDPKQVEVWAVEGYPTSEVIGVQRPDGVDVYAVEDLPQTSVAAITDELIRPGSNSADTPRLLTWPKGPAVGMAALVGGILRVNEAGCFALDHWILVVPPGSTVSLDGRSIVIPQLGRFSIGDTFRGGAARARKPTTCWTQPAFRKMLPRSSSCSISRTQKRIVDSPEPRLVGRKSAALLRSRANQLQRMALAPRGS